MVTEDELEKNNYQYMDHCYCGSKLGEKTLDARIKANNLQDDYVTLNIHKSEIADILAMIYAYEMRLRDDYNGEGPDDNAWDVGDEYESLHDIITDAGYKVYERSLDTPADCKLKRCYVI